MLKRLNDRGVIGGGVAGGWGPEMSFFGYLVWFFSYGAYLVVCKSMRGNFFDNHSAWPILWMLITLCLAWIIDKIVGNIFGDKS